MKRTILFASIVLIVIGIILLLVGNSMSTLVPTESGAMMVQDSILMPIGGLIIGLGVLTLMVALVGYFVGFIRSRSDNEH